MRPNLRESRSLWIGACRFFEENPSEKSAPRGQSLQTVGVMVAAGFEVVVMGGGVRVKTAQSEREGGGLRDWRGTAEGRSASRGERARGRGKVEEGEGRGGAGNGEAARDLNKALRRRRRD